MAKPTEAPANNPAQKQYVCPVIANMVARGIGAWAANARVFRDEVVPYPPPEAEPWYNLGCRVRNFRANFHLTFNHKLLIVNECKERFAGDCNVGDS